MSWLALRAFLGRIPRGAWIGLAIALVLAAGGVWHRHAVRTVLAAAEKAGEARAYASVETKAEALQRKAAAASAKIATALKDRNDEAIRAIGRDADAVRVRGPGKAACSAGPGVPAAAGGSVAAGRSGDAAVDQLPREERVDLIGLPFADTVAFAEQHDGFRVEALSWRAWYARFTAEWDKYRVEAENARKPD